MATHPITKYVPVKADSIQAGDLAPNSVGASELADNAVDTAAIAANALAASAAGRAKVQDGFFDAATFALKVAAGAVAQAQLAPNAYDGTIAANVAAQNVIGGLLQVFHILADQAGGADKDVTVTHKVRVIDVVCINKAAGGAGDTITVKNGANAISNAIDMNAGDNTVVRAGTIDDAQSTIDAAGTLRVTKADGAQDQNVDVFVVAMRVA